MSQFVDEGELPTTLGDALDILCDRLADRTHDGYDFNRSGTVLEMLADEFEVAVAEIVAAYGDSPVLRWEMAVGVEVRMTHRGAGWGSYYGPEPDEYAAHGSASVCTDGGVWVFDESFSDDDPLAGWVLRKVFPVPSE